MSDLADVRLVVKANSHADVGRGPQGAMNAASLLRPNRVLPPEALAVVCIVVHGVVGAVINFAGFCTCLSQHPLTQGPAMTQLKYNESAHTRLALVKRVIYWKPGKTCA